MPEISNILTAFVAIEHIIFLILEMFLWTRPAGLKIFKMTREAALSSAVLAKNQGLYNGFLAAGLAWGLLASDPTQALSLKTFFLGCAMVAGVYGGITADKGILMLQALPAALALASLYL